MTQLFSTGVSTELQVSLLAQINIEPGGIVPYERIALTSGVPYGSNRFRTIVTAWCKKVFRDQGMQFAAVRGVGLRFLTNPQALGKGVNDTRKMARTGRRIATRVKRIDGRHLSGLEQQQKQILQKHLRAVDHAARMMTKEIAVPKPVTATAVRLAV